MNPTPLQFTPPVIAHRGARAQAPENTLSSLKGAKEAGASWVEVDVKLTHDGFPILMHDDTLDRTTSGHGAVADMKWAELQKLDAGSWFNSQFAKEPVPSLSAAINCVLEAHLRINLEIKPCPGRTQATVMVTMIEMAKIWPADHPPPLISSFDIEALIIASRLHPDWPRGLLLSDWHEDWSDLARKVGASSIHMNEKSLTAERIRHLRAAGLPLLAYTVNDPLRAKELLHAGVSAVFSDNPGEIIRAL